MAIRLRRIALLGACCVAVGTAHAATLAGATSVSVEVVQTTTNLSDAMTRLPEAHLRSTRAPKGIPLIEVNPGATYQRVSGFGGALTDTSAWEIWTQTTPTERVELMDALFAHSGLHLDYMRIPMGATDFTRTEVPYSYDDMPAGKADPGLTHFSVAHDEAYILPLLHYMLQIDPHVELLANPWSPPGWMKANDALNNIKQQGVLLPRYYGALARYFVKFIEAYAKAGVPISAITPQNEPSNPTIYPGMELTEPDEAQLIADDLAPKLAAAKLHVAIYGNDLGLSPGTEGIGYAQGIARSVAAPDLHGIAWHCYHGSPDAMTTEHELFPRLDEIMDECSPGLTSSITETLISSLRNWASAVVFFNLALDPQRGPVQPPNHGCGPCTAESTVYPGGRFGLNLNFYQLGQVSHFVDRGAVRIGSQNDVSYAISGNDPSISTSGLDDVALQNPNGSKVLVAYNNSGSTIRFGVEYQKRWFTYSLPARATVTFEWDKPGGAS
jgi:glucosylceramidase